MSKGSTMNRQNGALLVILALGSLAAGCGGYARTPEQWTDDTYKLLEQQNEMVKDCYERSLKANAKLEGNVVVNFIVDNKTGRVRKAKIDVNRTTAGDPVRKCVASVYARTRHPTSWKRADSIGSLMASSRSSSPRPSLDPPDRPEAGIDVRRCTDGGACRGT